MTEDEKYMERCFQLAKQGLGSVSPNPMVGCVIVDNQGDIISEGYHHSCGENHAERNAILQCHDKSKLKGSTLYVNLEPCSHFGKTPPCADLIVENKIARVIISTNDPNPLVAGNGLKKLQNAGIEVVTGVLQQQGRLLNRRFFTFIEKKRPYVILKWATTKDGFMDIDRTEKPQAKYWITNDLCKILSHRWRTEEDAILVGTNTAINDNPELTARLWKGQNPLRLTIDRKARLPRTLHLFDASTPTIVFTENKTTQSSENLKYITVDFENFIPEIMSYLWQNKVQSLIVEGGKQLLTSFLQADCWDEARILVGDKFFQKGTIAPQLELSPIKTQMLDNDIVYYYYKDLCSTIPTKQ